MVVLAACGSGPDPVPLAEYRTAAEDALCQWAVGCRHVPDDATCRRLIDPRRYDTEPIADSIAAGRLVYDAQAAADCLDSGRHGPCPSSFDDPSCRRVFQGQVAAGGDCASTLECEDGAACEDAVCEAGCCLGRCGAPPPPVAPLAPVGEACETHFDCVAVAYCDEGTCRELPRDEGDPCRFGCWYGDLSCDVETLTCQRLGRLGEDCTSRPCDAAWAYCDGVCRPRPGPGEACDDDARRCIPSTVCERATCQPRPPEPVCQKLAPFSGSP